MNLAATIDAMIAAGCSREQLAAVVHAWEENGGDLDAQTLRLHARQLVIEVWNKTGGFCAYCGDPVVLRGKRGITIDHVVPISKGGTSVLSNLVPACKGCNSSKKDMGLNEYRSLCGGFAYPQAFGSDM